MQYGLKGSPSNVVPRFQPQDGGCVNPNPFSAPDLEREQGMNARHLRHAAVALDEETQPD